MSRDTFYRYQELAEKGGVDALISKSKRTPNIKNKVDMATEQTVIDYALEQPAHGQHRTSNELKKQGVFVSGSGVASHLGSYSPWIAWFDDGSTDSTERRFNRIRCSQALPVLSGKVVNAINSSRSFCKHCTAFGYWASNSCLEQDKSLSASSRVAARHIS